MVTRKRARIILPTWGTLSARSATTSQIYFQQTSIVGYDACRTRMRSSPLHHVQLGALWRAVWRCVHASMAVVYVHKAMHRRYASALAHSQTKSTVTTLCSGTHAIPSRYVMGLGTLHASHADDASPLSHAALCCGCSIRADCTSLCVCLYFLYVWRTCSSSTCHAWALSCSQWRLPLHTNACYGRSRFVCEYAACWQRQTSTSLSQ